MPSIDTNLLLRLLLADNILQVTKIAELIRRHEKFAVADLAVVEMVYVLEKSKGLSRADVAKFVTSLLDNSHFVLNRPLFHHVLPHYMKCPAVSFNDCCLEGYAFLNAQTPLYTFDQKLARQLPHAELVK